MSLGSAEIGKGSLKGVRVLYMGTPEFAVPPLEALLEAGADVRGVVTVPDKPAGRGLKMSESAVKRYALARDLPVLQPQNLSDPGFLKEVESERLDVGTVVAFRKLPKALWSIPKHGTFNLHASLLPQYRGAAPINWAIINGDTESGATTFLLDEQIDTGAVLLRERVPIEPNTTAGDLHDALMVLGATLVVKTVLELMRGTLQPQPQPVLDMLRDAPKIFRNDCRVDWHQPASAVHNRIRGLAPYPGAWAVMRRDERQEDVKLFGSQVAENSSLAPGATRRTPDGSHLLIGCGDGTCVMIGEIQPAGKRRMQMGEFLRGVDPHCVIAFE